MKRIALTAVSCLLPGLMLSGCQMMKHCNGAGGGSTNGRNVMPADLFKIVNANRMVAAVAASPRPSPKKTAPKKGGYGRRGGRESATEEKVEHIIP